MKRMYAVMAMPLFLGGCMMLGMGGMGTAGGSGNHGTSAPSSTTERTLVKESVVSGIRLTADFPPFAIGDALAYRVTLRDARDGSFVPNASMALVVTPDDGRATGPGSMRADSVAGRNESSASHRQDMRGAMNVIPDDVGGGTYVFHPQIAIPGAYRLVFVVHRHGNVMDDPPITVEQTIHLAGRTDQQSGGGHGMTGSGVATTGLVVAGVMALMMLIMLR